MIEQLLGRTREQFLAESWPHQPVQFDGPPARLGELPGELRAVDAFVRAHPGPAWHREETVEAAAALAGGATIDLRDLQRHVPVVAAWSRELATELRIDGGYCHAFVSAAGSGVPVHFDNRAVFVLQLVGRKQWRIAPNRALPDPLMPHVAGGPVHALNRHATGLDDPELAGATTYVMQPGSACFVPRGWWHETRALDESLSLSFGVRVPSWAELFVNTALDELAREPGWRAPAYDLAHVRPPGSDELVRTIRRVLDELRASPPPPREGE